MKEPNKLEKSLYRSYLRNCQKRNVFFGLSMEEFLEIIYKLCAYCDKPPSQGLSGYNNYSKFTGIDRVNPKWGYTLENVAPCCVDCNAMKSNRLTFEEARVVGKALAEFRASRPPKLPEK